MKGERSEKVVMNFCEPSSSLKRTTGQILPNDLVIEILERLPVRSLLRFKCLSKWCYDLIRSSTFINSHSLKREGNGKTLMIMRSLPLPQQQDDVLSFHDLDRPELEVLPDISISFLQDLNLKTYLRNTHNLLGSCNGIVCISYNGCIILCNPALREFKHLPPCLLDCPEGYHEQVLAEGFGITCSNEFMVILIRRCIEFVVREEFSSTQVVHLYTSSTNSWKQIDEAPTPVPWPRYIADKLFFNGACHWLALVFSGRDENEDGLLVILSFDMNTESFRQLELPDCLSEWYDDLTSPIVLNERLAVVQHQGLGTKSEAIEIWVMEEYGVKESWTLQFMIWPQLEVCPILSWKNDEWLLLETSDGQLASISFDTCETKRFEIYGVKGSMRAVIYEESLVSLNQGKPLCGGCGFAG